jgi:hypothetical protein
MPLGAGRHRAAAEELAEWWEDLCDREIGSQVVLLAVPPGWGRSAVLAEFRVGAESHTGPVALVAAVGGDLPPGRAVQAPELRDALIAPLDLGRGLLAERAAEVIRLLELDKAPGRVQLALGLGGLLVSGLAAAASLLAASLAVTAAGNAWDASPAGEQGAVARAARELARVSVSVPVAVIIDDADCLDPGLAVTLIRGLAGRRDGQVLVVAAAAPGSGLEHALTSDAGHELAGRVHRVDADPAMGYAGRAGLAGELLPGLPAAGAERIARRTATFHEVFAVTGTGRLADFGPAAEVAEVVAAVDAVADAVLKREGPSAEAVLLAWAGGALHVSQADRALQVLGADRDGADARVRRAGQLARLAGPADAQVTGQAAVLPAATRRELAAAVLGEAIGLAADPGAGLLDRVIARQAAHYVRADLPSRTGLTEVQLGLIRGLEALGDPGAAYQVATTALAELDTVPSAGRNERQRQDLLMAALRLAQTKPDSIDGDDPLVGEAVALALAGGAAVRLEARLWAAVDLLHRPGRRQDGLRLAGQVTAELEARQLPSQAAGQWRLLLAFHAGQAGDTALAQRLLTTMITTGPAGQQDAARAVLRAIGGPHADTRLQITLLQAELTCTPADADSDRLRLHHALADGYATLGDYRHALNHGEHELHLRRRLQGDDHPDTLTTRAHIAGWTGQSGDLAGALRLTQELLPDQVRTLGPADRDTLATRSNIAYWTGQTGDLAGALRLTQELLPDQVRVLGPDHPNTLATRSNIASWTGRSGDPAGALRLTQELLPDQVRILGPADRDTLATRNNIAYLTGESGDPARALRLSQELLPDLVHVLGPAHPETLATRNNIAFWTGESGDPAGALRLSQELLPDRVRLLGPDHPDTLTTRNNIASWTGRSGDPAGALRLSQELLPDLVRVLGPDHPYTLTTRGNIEFLTGALRSEMQSPHDTTEAGEPPKTGPPPHP